MIKIKKAKLSDAKEISNLKRETFERINGKDYTKEQIKDFNNLNTVNKLINNIKKSGNWKRKIFCAWKGDKLLGVIDLERNKIGGLFVKHGLIGKGIGSKLLKFIEDYARKKRISKVYLFSTKFAFDFYSKKGYKLIRKKPTKNRFTNLKMEKIL
ncbi:MAG: GNAT family N-acetyltransferase [Nanoarchaeota archaeon]|nr:GNAT family N-acetyltransferase [Nanoarchaeota archaeon]MBU4085965.1 GNAT family N-acetyltransferase [Nanoarchaeota archaeon]